MMVKYKDIHKGVANKLKSKFTNLEITSTDIEEGFTRPSCFVSFDNVKASDFMNQALDREMTVRIYYFPQDKHKNKIELLNIQDDFNDIFLRDNIIKIDEYTNAEVQELEFSVVDKVLHCYFDMRISEGYERIDDIENMEELQYKEI